MFEIEFGSKDKQNDEITLQYAGNIISFYSKITKQLYADFTKHPKTAHLNYNFLLRDV